MKDTPHEHAGDFAIVWIKVMNIREIVPSLLNQAFVAISMKVSIFGPMYKTD